MKDNVLIEIAVAALLATLVAALTYAQQAWMPAMTILVTLLAVVASFATFAVFVWKERGGDERENFIRNIGSRTAFLATGTILVAGIVIETLIHHTPSPWLGLALVVMVSAKIIGHAYGRNKY